MELGFWQVWEGGWVSAILRGAAITIALGLASMTFGVVIGVACGLIKWARLFPLTIAVDFYTSIVRGVPELLIIYLLFFSSVEFVAKVAQKTKALRQGPPDGAGSIDVGAVTFPPQIEIVEQHVQQARDAGARVLVGGHRREGAGRFFEPTVIADADHSMTALR